MDQQNDSGIIFLRPKKIISKKTGQELELITGKINLAGAVYDISGFLTPENGEKQGYIKFQIKPEWQPSTPASESTVNSDKF